MKNPALKKELVIFPLLLAVLTALVASITAWLLCPITRADFVERVGALCAIFIVYGALSFVLYNIVRKPTEKRYASLAQLSSEYSPFAFWFGMVFSAIYAPMLMIFVLDPLTLVTGWPSLFELPYMAGFVLFVWVSVLMSFCTYASIMWRYLTDEARENLHFRTLLAWPYKKGWMKLDNLA